MRNQAKQQVARALRQDMTDAERLLWYHLRNRLPAEVEFRRQAPVGPFVVDFLSVDARLVIEIDGSQHSAQLDAARTRFLERRGLRVLRVWNHDVLVRTEQVLEVIHAALQDGRPHRSPSTPRAPGSACGRAASQAPLDL
ncbi:MULTISPECIES: endonuclease domain-containing protein [Luteimonas]|uniref:endonuclease domain-containing protein n=1 Tax=Luteimonas TaxID=83614 RepID=UPI000C7DD259|nr:MULTISPECIES: DUF559 domain-containing protein [Luteimonas]